MKDTRTLDDYMKDEEALGNCLADIYADIKEIVKQTHKNETDGLIGKKMFAQIVGALIYMVHKSKTIDEFIAINQQENPDNKAYQEPYATTFKEIMKPFIDKYEERIRHISMANYLNTMKMTGAYNESYTLFVSNRIFTKKFYKVAQKYLPKEALEGLLN